MIERAEAIHFVGRPDRCSGVIAERTTGEA
jgi:hypothetical protein